MPKVSIITPAHNSAPYIEETIQSVVNQSYQNWEMIIVDDASKDESLKIMNLWAQKDERIKVIPLTENVGAAKARNIALEKAKGRYIAFLDSDDIWFENKLKEQLSFMESNQYAFTMTAYEVMNADGTPTGKIVECPQSINYKEYLHNTIIGCLTVMIDQEKVGKVRMPEIRSSHDMALWLKILKQVFECHGINKPLGAYRVLPKSNSSQKIKAAKDVWRVYREIEHLSFLYSIHCFFGYAYHAIMKRI